MKLRKFATAIDRVIVECGKRSGDFDLVVRVHRPGSIGGTPCAAVEDVQFLGITSVDKGFDWDQNKVILTLTQELTPLSRDEVDQISKSVSMGQSWHAMKDYQRHRDEVNQLKMLIQSSIKSVERDILTHEEGSDEASRLNKLLEALIQA